ncbi:MAG: E3 binding domain-containing protein [Actinobacteria bacterium]|nr:E3 binding domain-containing protein [Actinomycetota bacterium]
MNQNERPGGSDPDVVLDVPVLNIDELDLEVEDLAAHVSVRAELADLVKVNVGVDVYLNNVKLEIKGVEAQALLTVRLDRVLSTIDRALDAIDNNPQILSEAARGADQTPQDASQAARDAGRMAQLAEATPGRVNDSATEGAGDRLDLASDQAGRAGDSGDVTETTPSESKEEEEEGEESKSNLADLQIEEEYVDERGRIVGRARDESGNVVEEVLDEEGGVLDPGEPKEAEDNREREDDSNVEATDAARRRANETRVKLSGVKGTGSGGRILVKDVERAARTSAAD